MKKINPLKIIPFYKNEKSLIKRAALGYREAQQALYNTYSAKMLSVCRQYIKDLHFAEDAMINGFVKVFKHLDSFRHEGSFEGWVRRIMVRECISFLRKRQFIVYDEEVYEKNQFELTKITEPMDIAHIQMLIDSLPEGYKMVFVLYAIDGYKHAEIAKMLEISESTSKSQLFKARKLLQKKIRTLELSENTYRSTNA